MAELEDIKARLREIRGSLEVPSEASFETMRRWCWTAVDAADAYLARVEELEKGLRAILADHNPYPVRPGGRTWCIVCSPQDGNWPCVTVLEARAALGGEK